MAVAQLVRGKHQRILAGHPWVYANEIDEVNGNFDPGDIVSVVDSRGKFIGRGYINQRSQITIRLLTRHEEEVDEAFIRHRLEQALSYRKRFLGDATSYRLVHAEADFLPGLIVDKFGDYVIIQTLTLGIDRWKDAITGAIDELLSPKGIYERNDAPVRELEGLEQTVGFIKGPFDPMVDINENGLTVTVDTQRGQKTGYFLDQRENRMAVRQYARGGTVLDCFCYTGGFSINAAAAGAKSVLGVDQAQSALDIARLNAMKNNLGNCAFEEANVFDYLRLLEKRSERFDMVILDPPAFAKSKGALEGAIRGYKEINLRAMKIIRPGGILVTCSCSHHMDDQLLWDVVLLAASDSSTTLRLLERRGQAKDHPVLAAAPETNYLKCFIFEVH